MLLILGIYQRLLARVGLRRLLLVSLSCSAVGVFLSTVVCTYSPFYSICFRDSIAGYAVWLRQPWTTAVVLILNLFDVIGGGDMTRMIMITTCVAEISHPDNLYVSSVLVLARHLLIFRTTTYNYMTSTWLLASVGGATVASLLLSHHVYFLNGLSVTCFALTAMIAMLIPGHCGRDSQLAADAVPILSPIEDDESSPASPKRPSTLDGNQVMSCDNVSS